MNFPKSKRLLVLALFAGCVLLQAGPAVPISANSLEARSAPRDVSRKLEGLHHRVVEHSKADDDDVDVKSAGHHLAMSPERAVQLAILSHGGGRVTYIELQNHNAKQVYHVKVDQSDQYVDTTSGVVSVGDAQ